MLQIASKGLETKDDIIDRVRGRKKKLYLSILLLLAEGFTQEKVSEIIRLTQSRISVIAKYNRELLDALTLKSEMAVKGGRLRKAFRIVQGKRERSDKDLLDWLEYIRKEVEGEKALIDNSQNLTLQVVNFTNNGHLKDSKRELSESAT